MNLAQIFNFAICIDCFYADFCDKSHHAPTGVTPVSVPNASLHQQPTNFASNPCLTGIHSPKQVIFYNSNHLSRQLSYSYTHSYFYAKNSTKTRTFAIIRVFTKKTFLYIIIFF